MPESLQRVGCLAALPAILQRFSVSPAEVLEGAGLSARALEDPDATIPYRAMNRLAQLAAEKTECPHIGLEITSAMEAESLGLVGELMRNAPTLGDALRDFSENHHRLTHGSVAYLLSEGHEAYFGYAVIQSAGPGHGVICDAAAMAAFRLVSELARPAAVRVQEVLLSRSEPQDSTPYRRAFGVKVRFDAEQTALALPRTLLDVPVAGADARQRKRLQKRVASMWFAGELDTLTSLRRTLRVALLRGPVAAGEICRELQIPRRTLHRQLEEQGVRYRQVVDEIRCDVARQLLAYTSLGAGAVGTAVGYTDPSVFTRAFVRWTGMKPSEWRLPARRNHNCSKELQLTAPLEMEPRTQ
jgi:AraC-like DNA-binding protein